MHLYTQNGVIPLMPDGAALLPADAAAPNGVEFAAVVTLRTRAGGSDRYTTVDFPEGDYSAWPALRLVWVAVDGNGRTVRASAPKLIVPQTGQVTLDGGEVAVFGRCAYLSIIGYEICAIDMSGRVGFSDGRHGVEDFSDPLAPPAETIVPGAPPSFTSGIVAGEAFTINAGGPILSAPPDLMVTITYDQADDADGTNLDEGIEVTDLTAPAGAADKYLRIARTITSESAEYEYTDHSPWAFVAAQAEDVSITSAPAFTSAPTEGYAPAYTPGVVANQGENTVTHTFWERSGPEGTPGEVTLSAGKFPAENMLAQGMVRTRVTGDGVDITADSPWVDIVHLPRFIGVPVLSELTESAAFTRTPAATEYTTGSTNIAVSWEDADDDEGTGHNELIVTSGTMPASVNAYVEVTETMTDPLLIGAGISARTAKSGWVACANAVDVVPPTPVPTFDDTVLAYTGTDNYFRAVIASFSDTEAGDQFEWTTSLLDPIPDNQIEAVEFSGGKWQLQMTDPEKRVNPNSQTPQTRTDYSVFKFTGTGPYVLAEVKGERIRFRRRRLVAPDTYGPWSPWNGPHTCPTPASASSGGWSKDWMQVILRSPAEVSANLWGGPGLQFLRSFATSPNRPGLCLAAMDQNFAWQTLDGGETWETPEWSGMSAGRQGLSVWIDPDNADRQLAAYCGNTQAFNESGLFRSLDGGKTCAKVLALPQTRGTNTLRHNLQLICHKPGGTPATRAIFIMVGKGGPSGSSDVTSIQLYRSTDGGATWQTRGPAQSVATYANGIYWDYEIAFRPSGDLMLRCGPKGLWWSDDEGLTWTKATGLPGGAIHHMQIASNGTVFVGTNSGMYRATNGKAYSVVPNFGTTACRFFGMSPEDSNYIVAAKVGSTNQFYTSNALAATPTWTQGVNHARPGQAYATAHSVAPSDHGGIVGMWGDKNRFVVHQSQHYGVSVDAGANIRYAGFGFDGQHIRGMMGFHPTDWKIMVGGFQDIVTLSTVDGLGWSQDQIENNKSGPGLQIANAVNFTQYLSAAGAMIHSSRRTFYSVGNATGKRCIVGQELSAGGVVGSAYVYTEQVSNLSDCAAIDPNSANRGYIGRFRSSNLNAGSLSGVTWTQMARHFITLTGFNGNTILYGADPSGSVIYRSVDFGANWTAWRTVQRSMLPVDIRPVFRACQHHAARVYAISGNGYLTRIVGTSNPTETTIFDARNYVADYPAYKVHSVAVDPYNPDLGYVSLYMWGCSVVYRCQNLTTTTGAAGDWEPLNDGVPQLDLELSVHPLTSELLAHGSHGTYCHKPPAGHRETYSIANSLWDLHDAYWQSLQ